jgi:RNA polymerase sigma-70 factor (ECF subfamily)
MSIAISSTTESPIDHDAVLTAVANLPEHERLVVVLRYFDGHSIEQVAQLAGRPVGTVSKQLSRAMSRLKSLILVEESRR